MRTIFTDFSGLAQLAAFALERFRVSSRMVRFVLLFFFFFTLLCYQYEQLILKSLIFADLARLDRRGLDDKLLLMHHIYILSCLVFLSNTFMFSFYFHLCSFFILQRRMLAVCMTIVAPLGISSLGFGV